MSLHVIKASLDHRRRLLVPTAASPGSWDPDNEGLDIWAAYEPDGAGSFAGSLQDQSDQNNDASDPGGLNTPTWAAVTGWTFDGVYDYLDKCPNTPQGATVNSVGCWAFEGKVLFETNSSQIRSEAYPVLNDVAYILKNNPDIKVEIQGHTDSTGTAKYNQWLSEKRAQNVMQHLVKRGIDPKRLQAKGYGLTQPVASNDTPEGRSRNRRVELKPIP